MDDDKLWPKLKAMQADAERFGLELSDQELESVAINLRRFKAQVDEVKDLQKKSPDEFVEAVRQIITKNSGETL